LGFEDNKTMIKIAIFASGNGSNAENIVQYFKNNSKISVDLIVSNNKNAFVLERAKKLGIESKIFTKSDFADEYKIISFLKERKVNFIVLAGFLLQIPKYLIEIYPQKIMNIHPALLPNYGGKGMYGNKVHQAVIDAKEKESGITIHFVNDKYDEGEIIFQAKCPILKSDTAETVAEKIHKLEYAYFPQIIAETIDKNFT